MTPELTYLPGRESHHAEQQVHRARDDQKRGLLHD